MTRDDLFNINAGIVKGLAEVYIYIYIYIYLYIYI
jgi:hypothetical protein